MPDWEPIIDSVRSALGEPVEPGTPVRVTGGCINQAWRLRDPRRDVFVKINTANAADMFEAEAEGLRDLSAAAGLRVPAVYAAGADARQSWLALEWIESGRPGRDTERRLGRGLASVHGHQAEEFGWRRDNTIGSTPQINSPMDDWPAFFAARRIGFQLDLAERGGWPGRLIDAGRELQGDLRKFYTDYDPAPSLLHGDLWGGNWAVAEDGSPFIYDPAVYYGDREADLAMTELFGGFGADFYAAYDDAWRRDPGYGTRRDLYNLYHVLNHLNLFGSAYLGRAEDLIGSLRAELR